MSISVSQAQRIFAVAGLYKGAIDGDAGPLTRGAIKAALSGHRKVIRGDRMIAAVQKILAKQKIEVGPVDGFYGPQTQEGLIEWERSQLPKNVRPARFERPETPVEDKKSQTNWPRQSSVSKFYGAVGKNQVRMQFPYAMRLAWDTKTIVRSTYCHEKIHDAAKRVLERVADHYGDRISGLGLDLFGGCLNVRKMRGGSAWSMHSWGIAFDFDPARNQLRWNSGRAEFAKPIYNKWWKLWEEEGALSLGRARNYDWMHVQFARL